MAGNHLRVKEEGGSCWVAAYWLWLGLSLLAFLLGLAVRLYDITDPPLDFHPTRQLHSALIARGMYYQNLDDIPDWQRERAVDQWKAEGLIEPQIMEHLTAFTYRIIGAPKLGRRVCGLFSSGQLEGYACISLPAISLGFKGHRWQ